MRWVKRIDLIQAWSTSPYIYIYICMHAYAGSSCSAVSSALLASIIRSMRIFQNPTEPNIYVYLYIGGDDCGLVYDLKLCM